MNPGPVEEGAKVATSAIEGLKASPLSLALILMNLAFIGFATYLTYSINARTIGQYAVKDALIETLITKVGDNMAELRALVSDNATKAADHERRIRELEGRPK
jgi:hypothetical protein